MMAKQRLVSTILSALPIALASFGPGQAHAQLGVSDDRVSLPEGPGSLEGVGENIDISANMGLMQYQVSIEVPAGFAGLTPELALSYSSGNGSSVVGIGWDLILPTIERMTWKGLPEYHTGDLFAVNGSEQLVEVATESGERVYRARFEKGFVRYRWRDSGNGGGGYWVAEYPDGRIGYFGADSDGNQVASARVSGSGGGPGGVSGDGEQVFRYHLVEVVDLFGHRLKYHYRTWGNVSLIDRIDYVHKPSGDARFAVQFAYEPRQDVISDAGAGFELQLSQRLATIDVLSESARVRGYELGYQSYDESGGLSRLAEVVQLGYGDEVYPIHFRFGYSKALGGVCTGQDCQSPFVVDMGSLPGSVNMAAGDATLIDINGDALPDVLDTSRQGPHRFYLNILESEGVSRFAPQIIESALGQRASHQLSAANVQVLDVNGDGFSDLINSFSGEVLCSNALGDWSADGAGPSGSPCLGDGVDGLTLVEDEPGDPNPRHVRFIDIDNDKRIDVVRTPNDGSTQIYRNTEAGFVAMADTPALGWVFDEDQLQLADMNGDGLLDVVQIDPAGGVYYRLSLGFGNWSPAIAADGIDLTVNEAALAHIEDINGDALADVVVVVADQLRYALNRNAGRFDSFVSLTSADVQGSLPERTDTTTVVIADMNGSGTQDVVWMSSTGRVRYLELFPVRPNLLSRIENGIGSVQVIEYGTSVAHQARDRDAGEEAWKYVLPHAMNVVDRTDTWVTLTGGEDGQGLHEVVEYSYRHGYYDSEEKRFRGFERAETRMLADTSQEPGHTVSMYDVGADDAYYHGLLRSQAVFSEGRPIQERRMDYDECEVAEVAASASLAFPVRSICMTAQNTIAQEGAAMSEWATMRTEYFYDGYGNATKVSNLGVVHRGSPEAAQGCEPCSREAGVFGEPCDATCWGDEAFSETEYIVPGVKTDGRWIVGAAFRQRQYGVDGGETAETATYYDGADFVGLPAGQLSRGLVTRVEARAEAGGDDTIALRRNRYDRHGNVVEIIDPNGTLGDDDSHCRVRVYDSAGLNLLRTELLLKDEDGVPYQLRREMSYESRFNRVSESTAIMRVSGGTTSARNSTFYRYDAFGRVHKIIRPGDSDEAPSQEISYELADPASRIVVRQRSVAGGEADIESARCIDGRGRAFQTRTKLGDGAYQVTGFTEYNRRGAAVRIYQPYTDGASACATQPPEAGVLSTQMRYDALFRQIEATLPDDEIYGEASQRRTVFAPLQTLAFDPEDSDPKSPHYNTPTVQRSDGLGRVVAIERHLQAMDAGGVAPTTAIHYDSLGHVRGYRDAAGHIKTQRYDLLGRVVEVVDPNAGTTSYAYDAAGNLVMRRDGRGVVTRTSYDGANRPIARWDEADPDGTRVTMRYDGGHICPPSLCTNVEGRLAEVLYPVDLGEGASVGRDQFGFDTRGRAVYQARVLFGHEFPIERTFDNADRLVHTVYPDGQELRRSYDGASRLIGIDGVLDNVAYDERGQIEQLGYGNGTVTWHGYDQSQRLNQLTTFASDGRVLQGFAYSRDRIGNLLNIDDVVEMRPSHADATAEFGYDAWSRLIDAKLGSTDPERLSYDYDIIDNVLSVTSSHDGMSTVHVDDYVYDPAHPSGVVQTGSRLQKLDAAGYVTQRDSQQLYWDYAGRLTGVSAESGEDVARFSYNYNQVRVAKREFDNLTYYIAPEFEVRDGISVLYARIGRQRVARLQSDVLASTLLSDLAPRDNDGYSTPDGQINAADAWVSFAAGQGLIHADPATHTAPGMLLRSSVRRLLMEVDAGPVHLHSDHLGSLTLATSTNSRVLGERSYHPFGDVLNQSGYVDSYSFTGQERDKSTGLSHFQFRYLDTGSRRWLSPDPLFEHIDQGALARPWEMNARYSYVGNNPVSFVDPFGLVRQRRNALNPNQARRIGQALARQNVNAMLQRRQGNNRAAVHARERALLSHARYEANQRIERLQGNLRRFERRLRTARTPRGRQAIEAQIALIDVLILRARWNVVLHELRFRQ